jgi:hypothetical protein
MLRPLLAGHARRAQTVLAHPASRQLLRYIFAGLLVTQFAALVYSLLVVRGGLSPYLANVGSTGCGLVAGYFIHSRWFLDLADGQAARPAPARPRSADDGRDAGAELPAQPVLGVPRPLIAFAAHLAPLALTTYRQGSSSHR